MFSLDIDFLTTVCIPLDWFLIPFYCLQQYTTKEATGSVYGSSSLLFGVAEDTVTRVLSLLFL